MLIAVLLWQLAALEKVSPGRAQPMIIAVIAAMLAGAWVAWRFIFVVPVIFSLACVACLGLTLLTGRRDRTRGKSSA